MTACSVCVPRVGELPHESEIGWLCCWNARRRLEAALRAIPELVDELSGLGYVERDTRPFPCAVMGCDRPARWRGQFQGPPKSMRRCCGPCATNLFSLGTLYGIHPTHPAADPVAFALAAGPVEVMAGCPVRRT